MSNDELTQIDERHAIAKQLIEQGAREREIIAELNKHGVSDSYAEMIINNVRKDIRDRSDGIKLIVMGAFFIVGGLLLSFFSYQLATKVNAGFFFLYWGVVVLGAINFYRGISLYRK